MAINKKPITEIHEEVFNYLYKWNEEARKNGDPNPYFYMRTVRDDRFRNGYWFPGNDNYLCISFWHGADGFNKTPNIFLQINLNGPSSAILSSKDSPAKFSFLTDLAGQLTSNNKRSGYLSNGKGQWIKTYPAGKDHISCLAEFIEFDKPLIDQFILLKDRPPFEEFISPLEFIDSQHFQKLILQAMNQRDEIASIEKGAVIRDSTSSSLPLSLSEININNFQAIQKANVEDLPDNSHWIFLTGENGYGKTTVLQAIALGRNTHPDLTKFLGENTLIETVLTVDGVRDRVSRNYTGHVSSRANDSFMDGTTVIGYGPSRLNVQARTAQNVEDAASNPVIGLFENATLLKNINYELFASSNTEHELFETLKTIISTVTDNRISNIHIEGRDVYFTEALPNGEELKPLPLKYLAAGFRSLINMVFDIYIRLRQAHSKNDPSAFGGIVLIDEIENHLHPKLQRELPGLLSGVFPRVQFIASTHSPIPLLGAPANAVILRVDRTAEDGITIERLDEKIEFSNLLPNAILTSPIFGFENIFPAGHDGATMIRVEDTYSELTAFKASQKKVDSKLTADLADELIRMFKE